MGAQGWDYQVDQHLSSHFIEHFSNVNDFPVLYRNGDADVQQGQRPTQHVPSARMEFAKILRWLFQTFRRATIDQHGDHHLRWQQNRVRRPIPCWHRIFYWHCSFPFLYLFSAASNIVFSNGLQDPWSGGGVLRTPNADIIIIIIPDSAHHLDLRAANANDPGSVLAARIREKDAIRKWIRKSHREEWDWW